MTRAKPRIGAGARMFDQFKAMGAIAGLLKDKERVRAAMERFREKLERMRVTGTAGGGAVRVVVNGKMIAEDVQLDPALGRSVPGQKRHTGKVQPERLFRRIPQLAEVPDVLLVHPPNGLQDFREPVRLPLWKLGRAQAPPGFTNRCNHGRTLPSSIPTDTLSPDWYFENQERSAIMRFACTSEKPVNSAAPCGHLARPWPFETRMDDVFIDCTRSPIATV